MEELKQRITQKRELFHKSVQNELDIFMKYFKEIIEMKNEFFKYNIEILNKKIGFKQGRTIHTARYTNRIIVSITENCIVIKLKGIRYRKRDYYIFKEGIEKRYYDGYWYTGYDYNFSNINNFCDSTKITREEVWNLLNYLKYDLDIKTELESYIEKNIEKDIDIIDKYLRTPVTNKVKYEEVCYSCDSPLPLNAVYCPNCGKSNRVDLKCHTIPLGWDTWFGKWKEMFPNNNIYDKNSWESSGKEEKNCMQCKYFNSEECKSRFETIVCGNVKPCNIFEKKTYLGESVLESIYKDMKNYPNYIKYMDKYPDEIRYNFKQWKNHNMENENCMNCEHYKEETCVHEFPTNEGYIRPCEQYKKNISIMNEKDNYFENFNCMMCRYYKNRICKNGRTDKTKIIPCFMFEK